MVAQGVLWGKAEVPETASAAGLVGHEQKFGSFSRLLGSHLKNVKKKIYSSFSVENRSVRILCEPRPIRRWFHLLRQEMEAMERGEKWHPRGVF